MLDWSMLDLAQTARISISTVKRFERSNGQAVSDEAVALMRGAAEAAGIRFLADDGDGPGIRLLRRQWSDPTG